MPVISISIPQSLLRSVDEFIALHGYTGRSEFIRDSIRYFLEMKSPETTLKGKAGWVLIVLTDHESSTMVDEKVISIIHSYQPAIRSFYHQMLEGSLCLNILVMDALWKEIELMIRMLRKTRGVVKVWYVSVKYDKYF